MDYSRYSRNVKKAVDFIEKNIKSNVTFTDAADAACMSKDNFWRVFKKLFRETIGSYIRGRRLSIIARKITGSKKKIMDICFEYGFESPEVFTRSFKRQFGVTPDKYRKAGRNLYFLERHRLTEKAIRHILSGGITLEPKIVRLGPVKISGIKGRVDMHNPVIDGARLGFNIIKGIRGLLKAPGNRLYAYVEAVEDKSIEDFATDSVMEVLYGIETKALGRGLAHIKIPRGKYALFIHKGGIDKLFTSYEYIFGNWAKNRGGKKTAGYFFEISEKKYIKGETLRLEIYIPRRMKR